MIIIIIILMSIKDVSSHAITGSLDQEFLRQASFIFLLCL